MSEASAISVLDDLTQELVASVRRATAAAADANLIAQLDSMRADLEAAIPAIEESMTVIIDSPLLKPSDEQQRDLASRKTWLSSQLANTREALTADPATLRKGKLWRDTKQAVETLKTELVTIRAEAYAALLEEFAIADRELLQTLPPGTPGVRDYRAAIEEFERISNGPPRSAEQVAKAAAAGRRLRMLREQVENDAVPSEFQEQWRALRGDGLPLTALTEDFQSWLAERGLARTVVLRYSA